MNFNNQRGSLAKSHMGNVGSNQSFYNNLGQLVQQIDPDGVTTLYSYNDKGELEYTAVDMDRNGTIDYNGTDRITRTQRSVVSGHGTTVQRTATTVWTTAGTGTTLTTGVLDTSIDGLQTWQISFGLTNYVSTTIDSANQRRTVTTTAPDGSYTVSISDTGRVTSVTRYDAGSVQLSAVSYQYDAAGRQTTVTDARTGATTTTYNNADQPTVLSVGGQTTTYQYDNLGRVTTTTLPDSAQVFAAYWPTGEIATNWGARTYPVAYTYDYAGRQKTMKTWKDFSSNTGTATTTWNYDAQRGFLTSKQYADGAGPWYTYTAAGRLQTRTWARGITTTYGYNNAGDLGTITYSDGTTPNVSVTFDRRGRRTQVVDGAGTHTFTYNDAGQLLTESFPNSSAIITNTYDSLLRRSSLASLGQSASYAYDNASRVQSVSDGTHSVTYTFLPNSAMVSNIVFQTSGVTKMTTTKNYDDLNRLTAISSQPSDGSPVSYNYTYNLANQRTQRMDADGSYWQYGYDSLGQVTSGSKKWSDNSQVSGQQYTYGFDDIGNRKSAASGGPGSTSTYSANSLNQYTQRTVPGDVWELGSATNSATVTINNQAVNWHGDYFSMDLSVANSSAPIYTQLTTVAVLKNAGSSGSNIVTLSTGSVFVAKSPEIYRYDSDGNLTTDGRWTYTWDAENRLVQMQTVANLPASVPQQKLLFTYDSQSRRISKVVSNWNGSVWTAIPNLKFVYDGWNLLAEVGTTGAVVRSYLWGLDLSGSMQGAGGIGGLLVVNLGTNGTHFVAYDGNGNVATLVEANGGGISGRYDYGPFGEVIKKTGAASGMPFRFSTKYQDEETGLLDYGYRYYQPVTGRWLSRDPIAESGGNNLYHFVSNDTTDMIDPDGQGKKSATQSNPIVPIIQVITGKAITCNGKPLGKFDVFVGIDMSGTNAFQLNVSSGYIGMYIKLVFTPISPDAVKACCCATGVATGPGLGWIQYVDNKADNTTGWQNGAAPTTAPPPFWYNANQSTTLEDFPGSSDLKYLSDHKFESKLHCTNLSPKKPPGQPDSYQTVLSYKWSVDYSWKFKTKQVLTGGEITYAN